MSSALLEYLQQQPGITFKKLYRQPSTVLAVIRRMLPHLAKIIVMAMLWMPDPFPEADLFTWIKTDARRERDEAIGVLERLHIMAAVPEPATPRAYALTPSFATSLKQALTGGGNHKSFGVPVTPPKNLAVDVNFLDRHARSQWEAMLFYMVGSTGFGAQSGMPGSNASAKVAQGTKTLLQIGHFVMNRGSQTSITKEGFTFLLQDANIQVWNLLIVYLENCENLSMDQVEIMAFLFTLGSLELGQAYSTTSLTSTQAQLLDDLSDYGLIYRDGPQTPFFYPTRLATTLTSDAGALVSDAISASSMSTSSNSLHNPASSAQQDKGYIILETNHRLYAYTTSPLQIQILALFCNLKTRFPNLVCGKLTKESIQRAIASGITADQIVSYLATHAHPQMRKTTPILPPTVVDQIRLWQIEGDRMKATPGFLMKDFDTPREYEECSEYAETLGVLVWKNDAKRLFFLTDIAQMKSFIAGRAQQQQQRKGNG